MPKKSRFADEIDEHYGELSRGGKVLQPWRGLGGNVRLSHLRMTFLLQTVRIPGIWYKNTAEKLKSLRRVQQRHRRQTDGRTRTDGRTAHAIRRT